MGSYEDDQLRSWNMAAHNDALARQEAERQQRQRDEQQKAYDDQRRRDDEERQRQNEVRRRDEEASRIQYENDRYRNDGNWHSRSSDRSSYRTKKTRRSTPGQYTLADLVLIPLAFVLKVVLRLIAIGALLWLIGGLRA